MRGGTCASMVVATFALKSSDALDGSRHWSSQMGRPSSPTASMACCVCSMPTRRQRRAAAETGGRATAIGTSIPHASSRESASTNSASADASVPRPSTMAASVPAARAGSAATSRSSHLTSSSSSSPLESRLAM